MRFFSCVIALTLAISAFADDRPNVLILCGDDHAPYVMGAYGNTRVRTPNLDRLASQGMQFDRAYCNSPVCTASRQSLLTGRYPSTIGVTQLATPLPESETTLAEMLASAGYRTAALGKMHFNSELRHGFELRLDLEDHAKWLGKTGAQSIEANTPALGRWRPFRDPASMWLNSTCLPYPAHDADMPGAWFARKAAEFIQDADGPFFLMVSFYEPHSPFHFPVEYARRHDPSEFSAPPVHAADTWQVPAIFKGLTDEEKRGIIAAY
ncbi:MAG: sulfatase-like hydrolase/transferase, partial [Candidatus Hydrogenedentota bacterium]